MVTYTDTIVHYSAQSIYSYCELNIYYIPVVCMFPLQAQLRRELNEEKFKNEVLTKLVYMYIVCACMYISQYIVKYQYQLSTCCVHNLQV